MKLSIVIPVYNSESSLDILYDRITQSVIYSHEIIFIDDASTDNSKTILTELSHHKNVKVLHIKRNIGQQMALFCGLKHASGDYIVTMDDDLQHKATDINLLIKKIEEGYDLVYGVGKDDYGFHRHLGSKLTAMFFKYHYKHMGDKRVSSFRIFSSQLNQKILNCNYKFVYLSGVLLNHTSRVGQLEIVKMKRPYGQSGYSFFKLLKLFIKLNYYYGNLPEWMKPKHKSIITTELNEGII
ncbi:MAG: glycosyltransferase family 2 protein [Clostridiales bacterium]|nr:glycosyltransferase family 2 protein [Clostridiales bacterium]